MAGGTSAVPSNDSGTNLGRRKRFRVKEKTLRQVHGELSLDRADVVIGRHVGTADSQSAINQGQGVAVE